jgi:hypothetical protein
MGYYGWKDPDNSHDEPEECSHPETDRVIETGAETMGTRTYCLHCGDEWPTTPAELKAERKRERRERWIHWREHRLGWLLRPCRRLRARTRLAITVGVTRSMRRFRFENPRADYTRPRATLH